MKKDIYCPNCGKKYTIDENFRPNYCFNCGESLPINAVTNKSKSLAEYKDVIEVPPIYDKEPDYVEYEHPAITFAREQAMGNLAVEREKTRRAKMELENERAKQRGCCLFALAGLPTAVIIVLVIAAVLIIMFLGEWILGLLGTIFSFIFFFI